MYHISHHVYEMYAVCSHPLFCFLVMFFSPFFTSIPSRQEIEPIQKRATPKLRTNMLSQRIRNIVRRDTRTLSTATTPESILSIEQKWQTKWDTNSSTHSSKSSSNSKMNNDKSFYVLPMFPYPSGNLHMGHVRVYTLSDCLARYRRLQGYEVLHPIGWDAFGLPAENAARQNKVEPDAWTVDNIQRMKRQLSTLGFSFDWDKEVTTCKPDYYRWTQWLFNELHDAGLAYREEAVVNWDPVDCTVLANEQIDADGRSWRSGAIAERRRLNQWFFKITDYADELLNGLDTLEQWPEQVKQMQRNWIGRSEGTEIHFEWPSELPFPTSPASPTPPTSTTSPTSPTSMSSPPSKETLLHIPVFSTRVDTLMGVTFLAVAPSHPVVAAVLEHRPDSDVFTTMSAETLAGLVDAVTNIPTTPTDGDESSLIGAGFALGVDAKHPITGELIPIFVADYVISDYGHAAVMGVPAHDQRDYDFAQTHSIDVRTVLIENEKATEHENEEKRLNNNDTNTTAATSLWTDQGILINSGTEFDGLNSIQAMEAMGKYLSQHNCGGPSVQFRLRDWLVSRQRYWGAPIPIIHCNECGTIPVNFNDLPVTLPNMHQIENQENQENQDNQDNQDNQENQNANSTDISVDGSITTPLTNMPEWNNVECPKCHSKQAKRDPDTLDTFVDSSWYFMRYCDPWNNEKAFEDASVAKWIQAEKGLDVYIGGIEHAILHLLYARFICRFLYHRGYSPSPEPFNKLLTQGMVLGKTYKDPNNGRYLMPDEVEIINTSEGELPRMIQTGETADMVWEKMSKSKFNGIDPDSMISRYGADVTRLASLFMAPPEQALEWDEGAVAGQSRWCERLRKLTSVVMNGTDDDATVSKKDVDGVAARNIMLETNACIHSVTECFETAGSFNVAIAQLMKLSNVLNSKEAQTCPRERKEGVKTLLILLAPFAPHLSSELWEQIQLEEGTTLSMEWPSVDEASLQQDNITVIVQIQGKKKAAIEVPTEIATSRDALTTYIQDNEKIQHVLNGIELTRTIVVPSNDGKRSGIVNFVTQKKKK